MPAPTSIDDLLALVRKSGVLDDKRLEAHVQTLRDSGENEEDPGKLAAALVRDGLLTNFQAEQLVQGKWRRFTIGKYRVLERLGSGGMGSVFLCEHKFMRRRVAVKVLPTAKAADPSSLERFYREARAVAAVDHPNLVHAYDIDQDESLHFIVMEYVDGPSLQEILRRTGPLSLERACHYISQAAQGLHHANQASLVHRDIKPANILVDRTGLVKILDMGLARFFNDEEDVLTRKYDENVLGTADYLAPEQADDSHTVDIRADIYSLGGTFYFLLTGKTPFGEGTVPQKLMWHRTRQPKPISSYRNDVPAEVQAIIDKMMAKEPDQRYQSPGEISVALAPWTAEPILPPPEDEMPRLSPAAAGGNATSTVPGLASANGPRSASGKNIAHGRLAEPAPTVIARDPKSSPPRAGGIPPPAMKEPPQPATPRPAAKAPNNGHIASAPKPRLVTPPAPKAERSPLAPAISATPEPTPRGNAPTLAPAKPAIRNEQLARLFALAKKHAVLLICAAIFVAVFLIGIALIAMLSGSRPRPEAAKQSLLVGKSGAFPTVRAALVAAKSGDRVVLLDKDHRECLIWDAGEFSGVQIQPADGIEVVWAAPPQASETDALLQLSKAKAFQIKGIRFSGEGRIGNLVRLSGLSPGLKLENLTLEGFTKSAIIFVHCGGSAGEPVHLTALKSSTGGKLTDSAILFDADDVQAPTNEYITVTNCRFDGSFAHGKVWFKKERSNTIIVP